MSDEDLNASAEPSQLPAPSANAMWPAWQYAAAVPLRVAVTVPMPGMKVRDLQRLRAGTLLTTATPAVDDVCVRVGGALMAWGELDHVDGQMAIRLTRLA